MTTPLPAFLGRSALALAIAALSCAAAAHGPRHSPSAARAALPGAEVSLHDQLEAEKLSTDIYKAYFPSLELARRAAISFHGQLLESHYDAGYLVLELDAEDMDRLRAFGFRFAPATEFIEKRNRRLTELQMRLARRDPSAAEPASIPGYSCYETVEETFTAGDGLIAARPTLASWVIAGQSWLKTQNAGGYDIRVLKLTNADVTGDKPKLFIHAAMHAREYTTAPLALEFARWLVNGHGSNADATWILDHHEVHLMLHANPDGRKRAETGLSWRKNVNNNFCANSNNRGVDLNRNFTFGWNTTNGVGSSGAVCNATYRGPSAGSEPETQAIESYVRSLWPDRRGEDRNDPAPLDTSGIHIDLHSYSQLVLWPWGENATPAPNAAGLATLGRRLAWFNGYTPTQSVGLYPTDGTSDNVSYGELGVPAYTIELGTSFFQSCSVYENTIKPNNLPALIYAAKVVRTPYITPNGPDVTGLTLSNDAAGAGVAPGTPVTLSASATDTRFNQSNGAEAVQAIAAAEYTIGTPPWATGARPRALQAADGSFNSPTEALTGSLKTAGLTPGRHIVYVRARDAGGTWGPVTASFLNILASTPLVVTEVEPNDSLANAQQMATPPVQVNASIASPADVDHYRVAVGAAYTLFATVTPAADLSANVSILTTQGQVLATATGAAGQPVLVKAPNQTVFDRAYIVRVQYAGGGTGASEGAYTLLLSYF